MSCPHIISYTIRRGDNFYRIARQFNTTVEDILRENSGVDPHNLHVGDVISVCPNTTGADSSVQPRRGGISPAYFQLSSAMRRVWMEHMFWTRQVIISIVDGLGDKNEAVARLLRNPRDIADIYRRYFGNDAAAAIERLITEHLTTGAEVITAMKEGNSAAAADANERWYANADEIARAMSQLTPHYSFSHIQRMLYHHLDLTKREAAYRIARNYAADVQAFDTVLAQGIEMADYFTAGLSRQFPRLFS